MGYATLGFKTKNPDAPRPMRFRIDPERIGWGFNINTSVQETVGGRVVQVLGATLSDITVAGLLGENRNQAAGRDEHEHPGRSWRLHKRFVSHIRAMQEWQSRDSTQHDRMSPAAVFAYPPRNWRFRVYIKDISDPDGGTVQMRTGKFSHGYVLTLFVVQDESTALVEVNDSNGTINKAKQQAINDYIERISSGIGWKPSIYNGNFLSYYSEMFPNLYGEEETRKTKGKQGGGGRKSDLTPSQRARLDATRTTGGTGDPGDAGQSRQGDQET